MILLSAWIFELTIELFLLKTIDTQFDMAPTTVLKKTIIPYQQYGIVYMFQQNKIYSFSSNGSILSINNLSNH